MSGTFVISLDFELMWGVRDHRSVTEYGDAVLGGREAIPQMLSRFRAAGVRATWATVGLLFARTRREMLDYAPAARPGYLDPSLCAYRAVADEIGDDEAADPYHFGRSLVDRILDTEGQEIGTHTFSHYYCLEPGQTLEEFRADLAAAVAIAGSAGVRLGSIVFPRNQMAPEHIAACAEHGIACYRGNPGTYGYRSRNRAETSPVVRAVRLADSILPLDGHHNYDLVVSGRTPCNVPASRFLRPPVKGLPALSGLFLRRILSEMTDAARRGRLYHLWWHPHNFGRAPAASLAGLDHIIGHYRALADRYGMQSRSMGDIAAAGLTVPDGLTAQNR